MPVYSRTSIAPNREFPASKRDHSSAVAADVHNSRQLVLLRRSAITVVQPTKPGYGLRSQRARHKNHLVSGSFLPNRRLPIQRPMWPGRVVKRQVLFQQAVDVQGTDRYDVVQQFLRQRPVKPLHHTVLPWTTHAGTYNLDAHVRQSLVHQGQKDAVVIHHHLPRRLVKRVSIPDLLRHPVAAGVVRGSGHHQLTPFVVDDVQNVEQLAPAIKGDLEIHRGHRVAVIFEECFPALATFRCWGLGRLPLLALKDISHRCLRYLHAQLLRHHQADAFAAVAWVVCLDVDDDFFNRCINPGATRSSAFASGYKHPPPAFDKAPVPADQCSWPEIGVPGEGGCDVMQPAQQKLLPTLEHGALAFVAVALHLVACRNQLQLATQPPLPIASGIAGEGGADEYANE